MRTVNDTAKSRFASPWWVVLGAMLGLTVANGPVVFFTFGLFLGPITTEFGWNRATFSSSLLVGHTLAAFAYPFMGRAIDRYGSVASPSPSFPCSRLQLLLSR